jgi:hypothetical protein
MTKIRKKRFRQRNKTFPALQKELKNRSVRMKRPKRACTGAKPAAGFSLSSCAGRRCLPQNLPTNGGAAQAGGKFFTVIP